MFEVKRLDSVKAVYETFPFFDKRFKLKEKYKLYTLYEDNNPRSFLAFCDETKRFAKIHACYTPRELRKHGYFSILLQSVLSMEPDKTIKADCLPDSFGAFQRAGFVFVEKKYCNGYTLYKTVLKREVKR